MMSRGVFQSSLDVDNVSDMVDFNQQFFAFYSLIPGISSSNVKMKTTSQTVWNFIMRKVLDENLTCI